MCLKAVSAVLEITKEDLVLDFWYTLILIYCFTLFLEVFCACFTQISCWVKIVLL